MRYQIPSPPGAVLELVRGDIVDQHVDAIVNAANESLRAGGGVCGAIHRAAGRQLEQECLSIGGCPTGQARITGGYRLPARHVIHAVGPRYGGRPQDAVLLASAYRSSLELARANGLASIAFPSISTGIFGYPLDLAAPVALSAVVQFYAEAQAPAQPQLVRFVLWDAATMAAYTYAATKLGLNPAD